MITEAILGVAGPRFAPMGVEMAGMDDDTIVIRPFFSSVTGGELLRHGIGVLNFADDALLYAITALTDEIPPSKGPVLEAVPYWWEVSVVNFERDERANRWRLNCRAEAKNFNRGFLPFNRAFGSAIEAVILATRAHMPGADIEITRSKVDELLSVAKKTGGERELEAFRIIRSSIS